MSIAAEVHDQRPAVTTAWHRECGPANRVTVAPSSPVPEKVAPVAGTGLAGMVTAGGAGASTSMVSSVGALDADERPPLQGATWLAVS